ncbi:YbaK/EbsC family protein [Kribbella sp. HUAS MG21]|uniref:YbaK/EbsC family protein n=1 Tax=Kribbella sp. HUAS MG21 TaxID=3160966 RepID=A0AAU7TD43_9ACTN
MTSEAVQRGTTYEWLIGTLDEHDADYSLVDHEPVGTTEVVSRLRGHDVADAAKCLMLMVKLDRRTRRHVLVVVPGDRQVDLDAVRTLYAARYVGFCDAETTERLARTVPGTVLPFAVDPTVELVVDPALLERPRLWFNAARLDRSVSLAPADYARIAEPRIAPVCC